MMIPARWLALIARDPSIGAMRADLSASTRLSRCRFCIALLLRLSRGFQLLLHDRRALPRRAVALGVDPLLEARLGCAIRAAVGLTFCNRGFPHLRSDGLGVRGGNEGHQEQRG